jgi:hypothetical protein
LASDKITVAVNNCCGVITGMQVVAISGANTRGIFDPHSSIPATISCAFLVSPDLVGYIDPCSGSVQTSTIDFVIAATAINDASACGPHYRTGLVPGFTSVMQNQANDFELDYAITTEPRTTVVFDCNGTDTVGIVMDAISFQGAFGM